MAPLRRMTMNAPAKVIGYEVFDVRKQTVVRTYGEGKGKSARRCADMLDLEYGAVRYVVRFIFEETVSV